MGAIRPFFVEKIRVFFVKNRLLFLKRSPKSGMIKCKAKFKKPVTAAFPADIFNNERGKKTCLVPKIWVST